MYRFFNVNGLEGNLKEEFREISAASLAKIEVETKVLPLKGYVNPVNIPLWFATKNEAELFYNFLRSNYKDKFNWKRLTLAESENDNSYLVNIISDRNKNQFLNLFDLSAAGLDVEKFIVSQKNNQFGSGSM